MPNRIPLKRPVKLQAGDRIGVVAPGGPVDAEMLDKGMRSLRRMGFRPVPGKYVLERKRYLAGEDSQRAEDLIAMFEDPGIKAIVCARGGYGAARIIPHLKPAVIRRNPKILVGSSDMTLLLLYVTQKCSLVTFHGPMVAGSFGRLPMRASKIQFQKILTGEAEGTRLVHSRATVVRPGTAAGTVTGGCLTLLCRSLKTPYEIQTENKILLIEDVNEALYRIDGMLWQLKQAGKFQKVRGVIFGEMVNCWSSTAERKGFNDMLGEVFREYSFPVLTHCPIGHGKEIWTIPFGVKATMNTDTKTLELETCGLR